MSKSNDRRKDANRPARLRILDKEVQIGCKPGEEDDLMQAAAYVDKSMRDLRRRNTTSSIEKIAIVAAINTANALLKSRSREGNVMTDMADAEPAIQAAADNRDAAVPVEAAAPAQEASNGDSNPVVLDSKADSRDPGSADDNRAVEDTIAERLSMLNSKLDELLQTDVANRTVTAE